MTLSDLVLRLRFFDSLALTLALTSQSSASRMQIACSSLASTCRWGLPVLPKDTAADFVNRGARGAKWFAAKPSPETKWLWHCFDALTSVLWLRLGLGKHPDSLGPLGQGEAE